jgi:hypothetical protein
VKIHLYALCWNDRKMLDFFFRHYDPWVDRYHIFDDGSTDGTREYLARRDDVVLRDLHHGDPESFVHSAQLFNNSCWKPSAGIADWVVMTNIDEHLHHPEMATYLAEALEKGVTVVPGLGFQMITEVFPPEHAVLWRDCRLGAPWVKMCKVGIFRPDRVTEINFDIGRHKARPEGDVRYPERDEVLNLHYKYLGVSGTQRRHEELNERLKSGDRAQGWARKYQWNEDMLLQHFEEFRSQLVDISTLEELHVNYPAPRWWREQPARRRKKKWYHRILG